MATRTILEDKNTYFVFIENHTLGERLQFLFYILALYVLVIVYRIYIIVSTILTINFYVFYVNFWVFLLLL